MAIPDPGGASGSDYESFNGPEVNVDVTDLTSYYFEMQNIQMDAMGPATMELSPMPQMIREGVATPGDQGAGVFPEGIYAARLLVSRHSDFQHFLGDVLNGVRNIGSAAAVIAEVYENADSESAAGLADVGFAFTDPAAKPPAGFRKVETWSEYEQKMAAQRGELAMSSLGDDRMARVTNVPGGAITYYSYPDGSFKQVRTTTTPSNSRYQSESTVTTTTIYGPDATVISTTTRETFSVYGGATVDKTTTDHGNERDGSSSTTSTVTDADGRVTVTNQTATRIDGVTTTAPASAAVTIDPGDHAGESGEPGPVEQAENQLDTSGEDWYVKQFGRGY